MQATIARSPSRSHRPARRQMSAVSSPVAAEPEHEGHGRRLLMAFEALETFPVLQQSRERLLCALAEGHARMADVVAAIESDVALTIAVLRLANAEQPGRGRVDTVPSAVELLGLSKVQELAGDVRTFSFFDRASAWGSAPQSFRLHALATQRAADRISSVIGYKDRNHLAATSLLHDIGRLVLILAYPSYPAAVHLARRTPEQRIHQERRELGVDHALVGGVLIRRWGLPGSLARPIEHHHDPDAQDEATLIRLADMLAHYEHGASVSANDMLQSACAVGIGREGLQRMLYEPHGSSSQGVRPVKPSPLSKREHSALQLLAKGMVYKEIATELGLSPSTVRTHLHNSYQKPGAIDRAQAVLIATKNGWI
ncbi:MAG: HDOD domain-containing protein [Solirubrobacteraceae bacterium]